MSGAVLGHGPASHPALVAASRMLMRGMLNSQAVRQCELMCRMGGALTCSCSMPFRLNSKLPYNALIGVCIPQDTTTRKEDTTTEPGSTSARPCVVRLGAGKGRDRCITFAFVPLLDTRSLKLTMCAQGSTPRLKAQHLRRRGAMLSGKS